MKRLALLFCLALPALPETPHVPLGLDAYLPSPDANPITPGKLELGRKLFSDARLSGDGKLACSSCHRPEYAFSDRNPVSIGIGGRHGTRRVPRIANRAYGRSFFWDGRSASLEDQVLQPISSPIEMGSSPDAAARRAGVSVPELRDALACFVRSILSGNSRYDRYMAGDASALTAAEIAGLRLFTGKAGCSTCHVGPNLTDERFHNTGAGRGGDPGRAAVTGRDEDRGAFKTPSLRDVARTPPYMHDGSRPTIEGVIAFYDEGGGHNPRLDPEIKPLHLTPAEKQALAAFLGALDGEVGHGD